MICLDIGSHNGQSLEEMTEARWGFDMIYGFEPMPAQYDTLVERFGELPNVKLYNFGLSDETTSRPVYGTNDACEASVYATKRDVNSQVVTDCWFVEASSFFSELPDTPIIVKMNCEGSEIPILNNLIDTGEIWKITAMTFDLDIRRCVGYEYQADELLARLAGIGFDRYQISGDALYGDTHREKIANWLDSVRDSLQV